MIQLHHVRTLGWTLARVVPHMSLHMLQRCAFRYDR